MSKIQRERCRKNRKKNNNYNEYQKNHRKELRAWLTALKESQPCKDCNQFYPACVMEYDHLPQYKKYKTVSQLVGGQFSRENILKEVAKCDLLCANCHRVRTHITRKTP